MSGRLVRLGLIVVAAMLAAGTASATIISATNAVDISGFPLGMDVSDGSPYGSLPSGAGEGARYFTESTVDVGGIPFNVIDPMDGVVYGPGAGNPGAYGAGTTGQSHYIFWDPLQAPPAAQHTSVFEFDAPIIAILWSTSALASTDATLGLAGVSYGGAFLARGLEDHPGPVDNIVLGASRTTLTFNSGAGTPGDWFRVVTAVPEPSSMALLVAGSLGLVRRSRRQR